MKIQIKDIDQNPIDYVSYWTIPTGSTDKAQFQLPILSGKIKGLPVEFDACIVASDLQGVVLEKDNDLLLGQSLVEHLDIIFEISFSHLNPKNVLVLLCGDNYANLIKRGESGSPFQVWKAFSDTFGNVVGIAGNHDIIKDTSEYRVGNRTLLLKETIEIKGLKIAGLSGIIGNPSKPFRLTEIDYFKSLEKLLKQKPDILLTHLSPADNERNLQGDENLSQKLAKHDILSFCGHSNWNEFNPIRFEKANVLNADSKCYIFENEKTATNSSHKI
ncbi:MAG: metallophosphoesterase [Bacteroidia bacterium]